MHTPNIVAGNLAQQLPTTRNNMQQQQRVQMDATCNWSNNVGSCWSSKLRPFARGLRFKLSFIGDPWYYSCRNIFLLSLCNNKSLIWNTKDSQKRGTSPSGQLGERGLSMAIVVGSPPLWDAEVQSDSNFEGNGIQTKQFIFKSTKYLKKIKRVMYSELVSLLFIFRF